MTCFRQIIINFNLKNLGVDDFKAQAHIDAMDFRGVEGLISKYFRSLITKNSSSLHSNYNNLYNQHSL